MKKSVIVTILFLVATSLHAGGVSFSGVSYGDGSAAAPTNFAADANYFNPVMAMGEVQ